MNMIVESNQALALDGARLRRSLVDLTIDGKPAFDRRDAAHQARIDDVVAGLTSLRDDQTRAMETCASIKARAGEVAIITDDNMGEEW
jgi:hypothetical protein